jgi:membrane protein DedA with SNARE-associated domain
VEIWSDTLQTNDNDRCVCHWTELELADGSPMLGSLFHPSSYLGIFLFIASTGCGMPIPEEAAIVVAGVLSAQGHLKTELAFAACLAGALVGDSFMYWIGYRWGHRFFMMHPRFEKLFAAENEEQFQKAIESHALKVMLLARFLIGIRAPVYVMTGVVRMPYRRFVLYDFLSAALVVSVVFGLAYLFGESVTARVRRAEGIATLVVLLVIAVVGGILYFRNRKAILDFIFGPDVQQPDSQPAPSSRENP